MTNLVTLRTPDSCERCGRSPTSQDCQYYCGVSFCRDCYERRRETCEECCTRLAARIRHELEERRKDNREGQICVEEDCTHADQRKQEGVLEATSILDDYKRHLEVERGYSHHTVRAYVGTVRELAESSECSAAGGLDTMTKMHLRTHIASFRKLNKPATRDRRLSALRSFYRYRVKLGAIEEDPTAGIQLSKPESPLPSVLSVEACTRLIEGRPPKACHISALLSRDHAIFDVFYVTGISVAALAELNVRDLSLERRELRVIGKGNNERVAPIPSLTLESLLTYFAVWDVDVDSDGPLFLNTRGGRLSERGVRKTVRKRLEEAGIRWLGGLDALRHSCAMHLHEVDLDPPATQEPSGTAGSKTGAASLLLRFPSTRMFRAPRSYCGSIRPPGR